MPATPPPPPQPPAIEQPAPYEVSYGAVTGTAPAGTRRIVVRIGKRVLVERPLRGRHFSLSVDLPPRDLAVTVTAVRGDGRRSSRSVDHVFGLPRSARPRLAPSFEDPGMRRDVAALARGYPGTAAVYVQSLTSGAGAAWNARATFPAASTLKLAIAVTALAREQGPPARGAGLDGLMRQMLIVSDNASANAVERWFGGSTSGGSAAVNGVMRSLGLVDTEMYGGYTLNTFRSPQGAIPLRVDRQPGWGFGKKTSAYDLAALVRSVWLASGGLGPLRKAQPGFTASEARYLLYVLAHVHDPGKLDRQVGAAPDVAVLHKAGWINSARHDAGLVFWRGGVYVAAVMTYSGAGAGPSSDVLAGRVAAAALARLRG